MLAEFLLNYLTQSQNSAPLQRFSSKSNTNAIPPHGKLTFKDKEVQGRDLATSPPSGQHHGPFKQMASLRSAGVPGPLMQGVICPSWEVQGQGMVPLSTLICRPLAGVGKHSAADLRCQRGKGGEQMVQGGGISPAYTLNPSASISSHLHSACFWAGQMGKVSSKEREWEREKERKRERERKEREGEKGRCMVLLWPSWPSLTLSLSQIPIVCQTFIPMIWTQLQSQL